MSAGSLHYVLIKTCLQVVSAIVLIFLVLTVGPKVEGRIFPVVGKLHITAMSYDPIEKRTVLQVEFNKIRDCEYLGLAWFVRLSTDSFERVPVEIRRASTDKSSPNRPTGLQRSGPWLVNLDPETLKNRSFALLSHRCNPFWVTTTEFYP